jgi:hypothetical protein
MEINMVDESLERAEECRRLAAKAISTADAIAWLSLADEWRKLGQVTDVAHTLVAATQAAGNQGRSLASA